MTDAELLLLIIAGVVLLVLIALALRSHRRMLDGLDAWDGDYL